MARLSPLRSPLDPPDQGALRKAAVALSFTAGAAIGTVFWLLLGSLAMGIAVAAGSGIVLTLASLPGAAGTRT